jgi:DNA-binding CsgD family transcriptional regulator/DNA-binding beta-propeller fold protein YncE
MKAAQGSQGTLSRREREIAALVAQGLTNRAIAERMFISERTVDSHLEHVREKLGVSNRAQVATWIAAHQQSEDAGAAVPNERTPRRWRLNRWLAAASVLVVGLAGSALVYERQLSPAQAAPSVTAFTSVDPADQMVRPWAVAVAHDGTVYLADSFHLRITKVDPKARSIALFAGGNPLTGLAEGSDRLEASIGSPTGLAFPPNGNALYFASTFGDVGMVGRIDPDSTVHWVAGARSAEDQTSPMVDPAGIAFAADGTLYIADVGDNRVWKRSPNGLLTVFAGNGTEGFAGDLGAATEAELDRPRGVAVEPNGDVLIADTDNNRIREVLQGSNEIVTLAGSGNYYGFSGDSGPAIHASLSLPWDVAVGPGGTVYITDTGNDRIRAIDAKGDISTLLHAAPNSAPTGLAVTAARDLYFVEFGDPWLRVVHVSSQGSA